MEIFPDTSLVTPDFGIKTSEMWRTLITDFESGKEQRKKKWAFPKRKVNIPYNLIHESEIENVWDFYHDRSGAYEAFWFYFIKSRKWKGEYIGKGDDSTVTFDLPSKSTDESSLTVYVDGTPTSVTFLSGGGQASSDRIQFSVAPAANALITATFKGILRLKARFAEDNLDDELFKYMIYNFGLTILETK